MKSTVITLFQAGVHVPHGAKYFAARIKNWPAQNIPSNFSFTSEQIFKAKFIPRDTGKIPKEFVLSVLYRHQPCEVSELWSFCARDPRIVLDSKKHLRDVLQEMRSEGYITFEKNTHSHQWECHLTRERHKEVRELVLNSTCSIGESSEYPAQADLLKEEEEELSTEKKAHRLRELEKKLEKSTRALHQFQNIESDYLPYTDLNGKVNFMWWYETVDVSDKRKVELPIDNEKGESVTSLHP